MKVTATIQARMGSERLPGKVLKEVRGKPLLQYQIERIKRSRTVDEVIIATTTSEKDQAIVDLAHRLNVACFRGSEEDVLGRIVALLKEKQVQLHVELVGDSPLVDPQLIDEMVATFLKYEGAYDFVSNGMKVTYPAGMEVNVYPAAALIEAESRVAPDDPLREHVDIHLSRNPAYKCLNLEAPDFFRRPDIFLEVDTANDFAMMSTLIEAFLDADKVHFGLAQILDYLAGRQDLVEMNQNETRKYWEFKEKTI